MQNEVLLFLLLIGVFTVFCFTIVVVHKYYK
jgi:hypothetical protein